MDTWHITPITDDVFGIAEAAEAIGALVSGLRSALELADSSVLVWELRENSQTVGRAAVQVGVGLDFFEQFFNSSRGYRALFRRGRRIGSAANAALIDTILLTLARRLPESVNALLVTKIGDALQIAGRTTVDRSKFLRSLDPSLAKVWYATAEISSENIRWLSSGVSESKIDVGLEYMWKKIQQDPGDCIIEVKGAFVAPCGLFQVKDPEVRATGLSTTGGA
jgi:hypothetical protein